MLCAALTLGLCACGKTVPPETERIEVSAAFKANAVAVAYDAEPVFLEDIHKWADGNRLYNINDTYIDNERYSAEFSEINSSAELWRGAKNAPALGGVYNRAAAASYTKAHWNNDLELLCAPFVSKCLEAGGLSVSTDSSSSLALLLLNSRLGFGEFIPVSRDRTVSLPEYAEAGDIVEVYCPYEGLMIHSTVFVGNDDLGNMRVRCHNEENSGEYAYLVADACKACGTSIHEVFLYHFRSDGELLPGEIQSDPDLLLFERSGYAIQNECYNAENAAEYSRKKQSDGIGQFGAVHTSEALSAGGLSIGYPVQTALFFQLMKSRHGIMRSIPIDPDRTVTLPSSAKEGDVCFLYCPSTARF